MDSSAWGCGKKEDYQYTTKSEWKKVVLTANEQNQRVKVAKSKLRSFVHISEQTVFTNQ